MKNSRLFLFLSFCLLTTISFSQKYEAELATITGTGDNAPVIENNGDASGGQSVSTKDGEISFAINVPADGYYTIDIYSKSPGGDSRENGFGVDNQDAVTVFFPEATSFTKREVFKSIKLTAGAHTVKMVKSWGWINIDYLEVGTASTMIYEAENAVIVGGESNPATVEDNGAASAGKCMSTKESSIRFDVLIADAGKYDVSVYVLGDSNPSRENLFYIDGNAANNFPAGRISVLFDGGTDVFSKKVLKTNFDLTAGSHTILMDKTDPGAWGWCKLDYIEVSKSVLATISNTQVFKSIVTTSGQIINIRLAGNYNVKLLDLAGRLTFENKNLVDDSQLKVGNKPGIYLLNIVGAGINETQKIIIN